MIWNTLCYTKWIFAHIQNTRFKLIKWVWVLFDFAIFTDVMQLTAVLISQPSRWNPWYDIPVVNKSVHFMRVIKFFCPATPRPPFGNAPRFHTTHECFPTLDGCFPTLDGRFPHSMDVSTRLTSVSPRLMGVSIRLMGVSIRLMGVSHTRWVFTEAYENTRYAVVRGFG